MSISILGLGYIGLPTATLIASKGIQVLGVDINPSVVASVNQARPLIVEPDLQGLLTKVVEDGCLSAASVPDSSEVYLIAVPTPLNEDKGPDLGCVQAAVESLIPILKEEDLLIIESTCPVGTTEKMANFIFEKRPELKQKLYMAYCPERVLPGKILYELEHNDRVIGGVDEASTEKAIAFYVQFVKGTLHKTEVKTAEMCKLVENAYRDVNIAFANELSMICDDYELNSKDVIALANRHPRVNILTPGPGVGGHCIAVDPWFLIHDNPEKAQLMKQARQVNRNKTKFVIDKVMTIASNLAKDLNRVPKIACFGLSYKADVDDLRRSPALEIYTSLAKDKRIDLVGVEPHVSEIEGVKLMGIEEAIGWADVIVFLVGHRQFNSLVYSQNKVYLDICGLNKVV